MGEHQLIEIVGTYRELRLMAITTARELRACGMSFAVFVTRAREFNRVVVNARRHLRAIPT